LANLDDEICWKYQGWNRNSYTPRGYRTFTRLHLIKLSYALNDPVELNKGYGLVVRVLGASF
jgi:hypothetical protein